MNILRAYSNYDKEIGYTQGMNFIVAAIFLNIHPDKYEDVAESFGEKDPDYE